MEFLLKFFFLRWKSVVGLEIHAQIASNSKLFSGAENNFASPINSSVALLDASIPGALPVLNRRCVEAGIKTALALSCKINEVSMFDRKHYFYADLPAGYQITQQRAPLASSGLISFPVIVPGAKLYYKSSRLHQLQLEQDSGKSLHDDERGISLIDLNRAGVPLMELVFDPDLTDGEEAAALVKELILVLSTLETCNCRMEEGSLRVDANISIHKENEPLGTRTEVKNISSVRGVAQAISYEISRQIAAKNRGDTIVNETRSWDAVTKTTIPMRDKEVVQDYRFMPEPNLPPLHLDMSGKGRDEFVNVLKIRELLPALPQQIRDYLMSQKQLSQAFSVVLVNDQTLMKYFNEISKKPSRSPKIIATILVNELLTVCNKSKIDLENCKLTPEQLGELIDMLEAEEVNLMLARLIIKEMMETSMSAREIANKRNWKLICDESEIKSICEEVLKSKSGQEMSKAYKSGKTKVLLAINHAIINKSDNRIDMKKVQVILKQLLDK